MKQDLLSSLIALIFNKEVILRLKTFIKVYYDCVVSFARASFWMHALDKLRFVKAPHEASLNKK